MVTKDQIDKAINLNDLYKYQKLNKKQILLSIFNKTLRVFNI